MSELGLLKRVYGVSLVRSLFSALNRKTGTFGFAEALVFSRSVDFYNRYQATIPMLPQFNPGYLVEVGSGKLGIGTFLDSERLICLDISQAVVKTAYGERMVASASHLPFRNGSIRALVSVDCIEHLPRPVRESFFSEAKRVSATVVLHTPVKELCQETDLRFKRTHERLFGYRDRDHYEHIKLGQPTIRELQLHFPAATIHANQNRQVNYVLFVLQRILVLGWLTGIFYLLLLKRWHKKPPYYGATLKWEK